VQQPDILDLEQCDQIGARVDGGQSLGSESRSGLLFHPTVKPVAMCQDAIPDLTGRSEIVLDPFLGSGSTLIAAERTGRRCYGIELDPKYVSFILNRFRATFGTAATLADTGETLEFLQRRRTSQRNP
jgi:DNA modification methylase